MRSNKRKMRKNIKKKHNKDNQVVHLHEMECLLDDDEIPKLESFCNELITTHNQQFPNCDLTGKTDNEKVEHLKQRYIYYHDHFPKCISIDDTLAIAKNNYLQMSIKILRSVAKRHNIEQLLSISITKETLMPMDHVLIKYNKHKFQYCDEMEYLQELYSKLDLQCGLDDVNSDIINPKIMIHNYEEYDTIKTLFLVHSKIINRPPQHNKLIFYFKQFETLFPRDFCLDLQKCFLDSIQAEKNT